LRVTVVTRELSAKDLNRRAHDFDYVVDVSAQSKIPINATTPAQIREFCDPLMDFMQEVVDLFRGKPLELPDDTSALCVAFANAPIYEPALIDGNQLFLSVVSLTFRKARDQA
jgi:hypothetical protein